MLFQAAGITVDPWLPPLIAFLISFFTSMAGVSGAFLLLPFQMSFLGFTNPSVSATNHLFNIIAIPSGVYRYLKEGRMVWPLTWIVILGTLPGVLLGAVVRIEYLPDPKNFKLFAAAVLIFIGVRMLYDMLGNGSGSRDKSSAEVKFQKQAKKQQTQTETDSSSTPTVHIERFSLREISFSFYGDRFSVKTLGIFILSFVVGIVGGIYGIGGGSIIAPFFVAFYHLPVYIVAGAALMGTFVTSVAGVIFFQAIAPIYPDMSVAPDWALGTLFGLGGMAGMYLGARCQKHVPAKAIKWLLIAIVMFTAVKYVAEYLGL
ncbi:sulfite exporter TauE/SafE family protein [Oceanidesulfovibrio indonesiensis]|uniref:Probable membrane transporter protein n=1 Tax=Oceanidesulfovibrio indonesiensis TaxID=54767 RepID=A0A7M3MAF5_9BACT|nr:sulfite exporter TauE/SafE family protein [Oceanidesulfovibrio indonesiensis]TVM13866.1 sulfite exporter TauE/SafE family protein [Oceanidesulfovibrio indonesiensis]